MLPDSNSAADETCDAIPASKTGGESGATGASLRFKLAALCLVAVGSALAAYVAFGPHGLLNVADRKAQAAVDQGKELLKRGRYRQALAVVSPLPESGRWAADILAVKGLALASLGEVEPSRQALERSLALQANHPMATKVLAAIYFSRSEDARAISYLAKAAAIDPDDYRPWYAVGEAFLRLGQPEEAADAFRNALKRKSTDEESRMGLLTALVVTRPPEESEELLRELLQSRPSDPKLLVLAAWHARSLGQTEAAIEYAGKAIELDPDLVEALVIRAQLNHTLGKSQSALNDVERAIAREPNHLAGLNLLAQLQAATGKSEESRATFARHRKLLERSEQMRKLTLEIEKRPEDSEPRWKLGKVAAEGGAVTRAVQSYRAALALDPHCQPAIQGLHEIESRGIRETSSPSQPQWSLPTPSSRP